MRKRWGDLVNFVETPSEILNYRRIRTRTLSVNLSRYLYRNARLFVEGQIDFLPTDEEAHARKEHLLTLGVDWAL